ncbi:MAG TPA: type II secretion system protein [Pseudomonadales bacterium]|nr:type II secretion system protein [Pseudomonadales bacterium]
MRKHLTPNSRLLVQKSDAGGFTFTELLVVIAVLAILMSVLASAFASVKPESKVVQCLDGKRQLTLAWEMYASDNSDKLMNINSWVSDIMDWTSSSQNTNTALLTNPANALIAGYNNSAFAFKCPADYYQSTANPGSRVRSVSMNIMLTGTPIIEGIGANFRKYLIAKKLSDLAQPGPAMVYVFLDEHADSINDGTFAFNAGYSRGLEKWRDLPAAYHDGACGMSFADGHVEMHPWLEKSGVNKTIYPVLIQTYVSNAPWSAVNLGISQDYEWLDEHIPYF